MKQVMVVALVLLGLSACGVLKPHEKIIQQQAQQAQLVPVNKSRFDASYILPSAHFQQYKKIIVSDLDLSTTNIIKPSSSRAYSEPWELNQEDRRYYQEKYRSAAKKFLVVDGYAEANHPNADTLLVKTRITEIAPLASKDDSNGRPNLIDVYSEGFGRMTINFEVRDSVSNRLIAVISDERDLGHIWEKNNRVQNNHQIKLAFDYWLKNLKEELDNAK